MDLIVSVPEFTLYLEQWSENVYVELENTLIYSKKVEWTVVHLKDQVSYSYNNRPVSCFVEELLR